MDVQRSFPPGTPWAYFKLYCGETTADRLLPTHIGPLAERLQDDGLVSHWFFIRYADPAPHLRVRFHLTDVGGWSTLLALVNERLADPFRHELIWKVQVDTYERELERYGSEATALAERLFHQDSVAAIRAIRTIHELEDEDFRWQAALLSLQHYARDFGYDTATWLQLVEPLAGSLLGEVDKPKEAARRLDGKFRDKRPAIEAIQAASASHPRFGGYVQALEARSRGTEVDRLELAHLAATGKLPVPLNTLVGAYLHMSCNRLFATRHRQHELVAYWMLVKILRSQLARQQRDQPATL